MSTNSCTNGVIFCFFYYFFFKKIIIFPEDDKIFHTDKQHISKNNANIFSLFHKLVYLCIVKLKQKSALVIKEDTQIKTTQLWKTQMNKKR